MSGVPEHITTVLDPMLFHVSGTTSAPETVPTPTPVTTATPTPGTTTTPALGFTAASSLQATTTSTTSPSTNRPPILVGSRCEQDGTVVFPAQASCPQCSGRSTTHTTLPSRGRLWSWTVQHFPPKAPYRGPVGAGFIPYPVGYVDLGEVIVEARLQVADPAMLRIEMPMQLTWLRLWIETDGRHVLTYAFEPEPPG